MKLSRCHSRAVGATATSMLSQIRHHKYCAGKTKHQACREWIDDVDDMARTKGQAAYSSLPDRPVFSTGAKPFLFLVCRVIQKVSGADKDDDRDHSKYVEDT